MAKKSSKSKNGFINSFKKSQKLQVIVVFALLFGGFGSYQLYKTFAQSPDSIDKIHYATVVGCTVSGRATRNSGVYIIPSAAGDGWGGVDPTNTDANGYFSKTFGTWSNGYTVNVYAHNRLIGTGVFNCTTSNSRN